MTSIESPSEWKLPEWHPDLRVPAEKELELLREIAMSLQTRFPKVKPCLVIPEPGLIFVQLDFVNELNAEVYATATSDSHDDCEFAIYFSPGSKLEEEFQVRSVDDALAVIASRL